MYCLAKKVADYSIEYHKGYHNKKRKDILPLFLCFKDRVKAQCLRVFAKDLFETTKMSLLMVFEKIPPRHTKIDTFGQKLTQTILLCKYRLNYKWDYHTNFIDSENFRANNRTEIEH